MYLCKRNRQKEDNTMINSAAYKGVFLNVPMSDWSLFSELIKKFGWQAETKEKMLDRFISSRPSTPAISEEDIMNEVRAARYTK